MNKFFVPIILGVVILIVGIFAFSPVEKSGAIHTTIGSTIIIKDVFADKGTAAGGNSNAITVDFLIVDHAGNKITGLLVGAFSTSFIAGTTTPGAITILVGNSGDGGYRLTIDPANNWVAGRNDIVLTATSGSQTASALIVVDI